jgi:mono/diheme cytochrome c family protein
MKTRHAQYLFAFVLGVLLAVSFARAEATVPSAAPDPVLARGRYLVERVGMCADCHSPRDQKGQFIRGQELAGAALGFAPTVPMPWSPAAPPIAGLPSLTETQAIAFFQDGKRPDGTTPLPPMPTFRFDAADAAAVTAYLKSLAR